MQGKFNFILFTVYRHKGLVTLTTKLFWIEYRNLATSRVRGSGLYFSEREKINGNKSIPGFQIIINHHLIKGRFRIEKAKTNHGAKQGFLRPTHIQPEYYI